MTTELEEKRAARAAEEDLLKDVVQDADSAVPPQQPGSQVTVPTEVRNMIMTGYYKDENREPYERTLKVTLPKHPVATSEAVAGIYSQYNAIGAIIQKEDGKDNFTVTPLSLFKGFEFEFSTVVGISGVNLNVTK